MVLPGIILTWVVVILKSNEFDDITKHPFYPLFWTRPVYEISSLGCVNYLVSGGSECYLMLVRRVRVKRHPSTNPNGGHTGLGFPPIDFHIPTE